jgi:hypothetical protein
MDSKKVSLTRESVYGKTGILDAVKQFEMGKGYPIRSIPLKEVVAVSPDLTEVKVFDTLLRGAEASLVRPEDICTVVQMDTPKEDKPIIGYTDFKAYKGTLGSKVRKSGGLFDSVELDCSNQNGLRIVDVSMDKSWIKQNKWGAVEAAIESAGQAMTDEVINAIMSKYEADVDSSMTDTVANWGNSHYKALVKAVSLIAAAQMPTEVALINPAEVYDLLILDYFVHGNYAQLAAKQAYDFGRGLCGFLFPNGGIPIYFHPKVTAASMTIAAKRAVVCGIYTPLTIDNYDDIRAGEEGGIVSIQFDVKSGKDAKLTKPTKKAWAVATGA